MIYEGKFRNINNIEFKVRFTPASKLPQAVKEITLGGTPVTIVQESSELLQPIKGQRCTIQIVSNEILDGLYSSNIHDIECVVSRVNDGKIFFQGYVTPCAYSQPWSQLDTFEVEAVGKLSTLDNIPYSTISSKEEIYPVARIIQHILTAAGFQDTTEIRISNNITVDGDKHVFSKVYISESNFFDNDADRTPWTCKEVLEEICKYFGFTVITFQDTVFFLDYKAMSKKQLASYVQGSVSEINSTAPDASYEDNLVRGDAQNASYGTYYGNDSTLSFDEVFNKFEISCNLYDMDKICPDILDTDNLDNITYGVNGSSWTHTEYKWNGKIKDRYTTFYEYQTLLSAKEVTGWEHKYYKMRDGVEVSSYNDSSSTTQYNKNMRPRINTRCAMIQRYASIDADDPTPASLDWENYITFFCLDDTVSDGIVRNRTNLFEQPVLKYTSNDAIRYSPKNGKSWITFKGDLFYQCNTSNDKANLNIVNVDEKYYTFSPVDKVTQYDAYDYKVSETWTNKGFLSWSKTTVTRSFPTRTKTDQDYGKGFPMLKAKLKIGDKYWDGSVWTTTDSTFYINYNNSPKDGATESFKVLDWQSVAPNTKYTDNIGSDVWAIPITPSDNICGRLEFTLYTPSQMKPLFDSWSYKSSWMTLFPVIFMKNFELGYAYTGSKVWFLEPDKNEDDILYTNNDNSLYTREKSGIELKINTIRKDTPISKSFTYTETGFVGDYTFMDRSNLEQKIPEKFLLDKYYDHYHTKKKIYETTTRGLVGPYARVRFNDLAGNFVVDSYEYDVTLDTSKAKYIEY